MIIYEEHARDRMRERNVTEDDVQQTLRSPDRVRLAIPRPPNPRCLIYERAIGRRVCKVYVRAGTDPAVIATAMWRASNRTENAQ